MSIIPVITVDGASSSGKGTLSRYLSGHLGWHFLDSGAIYRVLGLAAKKWELDLNDASALANLGRSLEVTFDWERSEGEKITLFGESVASQIRNEAVGRLASVISQYPQVREALLERQRAFCQPPGLVADGRDMGTVVFPDASLKIFLQANLHVRAKRRYEELKANGNHASLNSVLADLQARDIRDTDRFTAPLRTAPGAFVIDTTDKTIDEVYQLALEQVARQGWIN